MSHLNFTTPVKGYFKLQAHTLDDEGNIVSTRLLADWFPNLILDQGLDRMAQGTDYLFACQVGSGNTAPLVTNTALQTFVAGTNTVQTQTTIAGTSPDWYNRYIKTWRFAAGVATGNLSEVGVGWATSGSVLTTRALILDGGGLPTTITVLASEALDVTYEFRTYPPLVDVPGVVTISAINYNFVIRAAEVDSIKTSMTSLGWGVVQASNGTPGGNVPSQNGVMKSYNGVLGAITGVPTSPSGTDFSGDFAFPAYTNGTFFRDFTISAGLNDLNAVGGISALVLTTSWFCYQVSFSPVLPKDNTKTMSLTFRHSWIRH